MILPKEFANNPIEVDYAGIFIPWDSRFSLLPHIPIYSHKLLYSSIVQEIIYS